MKDTSKTSLRRGHNEGNIRQRTDGRWEVRLSAGIDYKTGKPRRTSTCCNTRQEAIAILQQQAHEVRTQGWRDPMSVTLGEWYEYWLDTYMKDTVKQSTYASYRSYLNKHFCVLGKILLKKLEPHILQEFYNYKFREEGLSPKTLRNYHMVLHKCLQQAVKERLLVYNPCDAVTLPGGEKPEIVVFTNDQQRALVQASYRHRYGVFIRLDLCTGLRMGELLALKWEDIDFSTAQLHVRRTINRLAKYEAHDGENKTEIVFGTPKTKNSRRTIPLTRTMADELTRWKQQQAQDKIRAGDKYTDKGFIVTNEFGHYFEQKTFKDYYDRLLKDADIGHFTFHALRHTFATRALERGMDYKTLSAILGHYSVAFTMDTYVHSMDEHKRREMDKMDDMFGMQYSISVENQPYPVLCTLSADDCTAHVPDFPNGFPLGITDNQRRGEIVVPRSHKGKDGLHRDSGLQDRQDDHIEGVELAGAINASCLNQFLRQAGIHVLLHEKEHSRCRNAGQNQRPQRIGQVHIVHQAKETQRRYLHRHRHNEQDDGKCCILELEVVGVDCVCRQRAEVAGEC